MLDFVDDERPYLTWVAADQDGWVVNVPRSGHTVPSVLHTGSCRHISSTAHPNYTTTAYYKVCSRDRQVLERWLNTRPDPWKFCGSCMFLGAESRNAVARVAPDAQLKPIRTATAHTRADIAEVYAYSSNQAILADSVEWPRWISGPAAWRLEGLEPRLASWNSRNDPEQIRVQAYLTDLAEKIGPLPESTNLYLQLDIDVLRPIALQRHHDLENYLTPVVAKLGSRRFVFVGATKRVGGGSVLTVGVAQPQVDKLTGWDHRTLSLTGGVGTHAWKEQIRAGLLASGVQVVPEGPVAVQLAWRCAPRRDWVQLWKPTGDAMGPVVGEPWPANPFNPADDRIVSLQLHRLVDDTIGKDVHIGMWWRPEP
ncbi:MAG: hypothetical protein JWO42_2755 [Chloroflexi bacterium]|jgi:hypothetical protein|nr:hypothetical protein [Chloroflexota bacterium]